MLSPACSQSKFLTKFTKLHVMPIEINKVQQKLTPKQTVLTSSEAKLRQDIYRPDIEKLHLFTQMLRVNNLFKRAKVTH